MSESTAGHPHLLHPHTLDNLPIGDHACGLYETRNELYEAACKFIKTGLERKQQCFYTTEQLAPSDFLSLLKAHGVEIEKEIASGSLHVFSGKELRGKIGGFTPKKMLSFLALTEEKALKDGFSSIRWGAEMTWLKQDDITLADFFSYESVLNDFLHQHKIVGLCQYAKVDFRSELMIAAAETHPLFVYNELVCRNHYYIPPEEFLKPRFSDMKWERMIGNIVTREELLQDFLSSYYGSGSNTKGQQDGELQM